MTVLACGVDCVLNTTAIGSLCMAIMVQVNMEMSSSIDSLYLLSICMQPGCGLPADSHATMLACGSPCPPFPLPICSMSMQCDQPLILPRTEQRNLLHDIQVFSVDWCAQSPTLYSTFTDPSHACLASPQGSNLDTICRLGNHLAFRCSKHDLQQQASLLHCLGTCRAVSHLPPAWLGWHFLPPAFCGCLWTVSRPSGLVPGTAKPLHDS